MNRLICMNCRLAVVMALLAAATIFMVGCEGSHDPAVDDPHAGHDHGSPDGHDEPEGAIELSADEMTEMGVKTRKAAVAPLEQTIKLPGEVVLNPDARVHVVPRVSGVIRQVEKQIGDRVKVGDLLFVLDSAELAEAKADYLSKIQAAELEAIDLARTRTVHDNTQRMLALMKSNPAFDALTELEGLDLGTNRRELLSAYADYVNARLAFERQERLVADDITSAADFEASQSAYQTAAATYLAVRDDMVFTNRRTLNERQRAARTAQTAMDAAKRKLLTFGLTAQDIASLPDAPDEQLARLSVRSPLDGVVIDRHASRGEMLDADAEAFVIADLDTVWVLLTIHQKDLAMVQAGQTVALQFGQGIPRTSGKIDLVSPIVDEHTRTAEARALLANPNGQFRPGLFVTGSVRHIVGDRDIVVPQGAVQMLDAGPAVFVLDSGTFEARPVELGLSAGGLVQIIEGLSAGEVYAATNTLTLKAQLNRAALEHAGHVH